MMVLFIANSMMMVLQKIVMVCEYPGALWFIQWRVRARDSTEAHICHENRYSLIDFRSALAFDQIAMSSRLIVSELFRLLAIYKNEVGLYKYA